jgi:hypothetical protein
MIEENWTTMAADQKADLLREAFKDMIDHQGAIIAELEARITALEEQTAAFDRPIIKRVALARR